jgi:proteasome lid subunit RPN8/RPN11
MKTLETRSTTAQKPPSLRFTAYSFAKLLFLRDVGSTEIGGFGISAPDDLLLVEDIRLVRQQCSSVHVAFDDASVADFFDEQVDAGRQPQEFARIWVHTHPGNSAQPSSVDEETFSRVFGSANWALMFILARGGQTYARLRFSAGPTGELLLPVDVDYRQPFAASDADAWLEEYEACVRIPPPRPVKRLKDRGKSDIFDAEPLEELGVAAAPDDWIDSWYDYAQGFENLEEVSDERFRESY